MTARTWVIGVCPRLYGIQITGTPRLFREKEMSETKAIGRIIKVSKAGWGFISSREIEFTRIFFHWTALRQDTIPFLELKTGMMVEFTPMQVQGKGWRALHVRVLPDKKDKEEKTDENVLPAL